MRAFEVTLQLESTSPASFSQRSMWAFALRYRAAHLNEMIVPWRVQGPLRRDLMQTALGDLVRRHPTLRTRLAYRRGQLLQVVMPAEAVDLAWYEVEGESTGARLQAVVDMLGGPGRPVVDVIDGPTLLAGLYRLGADDHVLCIQVHHAMCDGWSIGVMLRDLTTFYRARLEGTEAELPVLAEQYADLARHELQACAAGEFDAELRHWRDALADLPPPLALPATAPRKGNRDWRASATHATEPAALMLGLRETAGRLRVSPFALLLSALAVLLRQRSGADDMVVGVPTLNRWSAPSMNVVGYMTSLMPVRLRPTGPLGFDALCTQAHLSIRKMLAHGRVPLEVLLRETALTASGNTVFPIWAQYIEETADSSHDAAGLRFTPLATKRRNLLAELDIDMVGAVNSWRCEFGYRRSLFEPSAMHSLMTDYVHLLRLILDQPRQPVEALSEHIS